MKIEGTAKEFAALIEMIQGRHKEKLTRETADKRTRELLESGDKKAELMKDGTRFIPIEKLTQDELEARIRCGEVPFVR